MIMFASSVSEGAVTVRQCLRTPAVTTPLVRVDHALIAISSDGAPDTRFVTLISSRDRTIYGSCCTTSGMTSRAPASRRSAAATVIVHPLR